MSPQGPSVETGAIAMAVPGLERLRSSPSSPVADSGTEMGARRHPDRANGGRHACSKGPTRQGPDCLSLNEFPSLSKESIRNEINYTIDTIPTATEARCGRMSVTDDVQLCKACPRPYLA